MSHVNKKHAQITSNLHESSALSEWNIGLNTAGKKLIPDDPDMSDECKHLFRHDITYLAFDSSPVDATYDAMRRFYILSMNDALELSTTKPHEYGLFDTFGKPEEECVHALHAGCSLSSKTFCNIADSMPCNTRCTTPWNHWNDKVIFTRRTPSKHLMKATASSSFTGLPSCSFGAHGVPIFQARHKYAFPFIRCTPHYECAPKL